MPDFTVYCYKNSDPLPVQYVDFNAKDEADFHQQVAQAILDESIADYAPDMDYFTMAENKFDDEGYILHGQERVIARHEWPGKNKI